MENKLLLNLAFAVIVIGIFTSRFFSERILGQKLTWPLSAIISVGSLLASLAIMMGFSSKAPDSTFFTLLPFGIYLATAAVLAKLFARSDDVSKIGIAESLLFGFVLTTATVLGTLALALVAIILYRMF